MKCVYLVPLQERELPENCRSHIPFIETKLRKARKEPSHLGGQPTFSELSRRSLKSPMSIQGDVRPVPISDITSQKRG